MCVCVFFFFFWGGACDFLVLGVEAVSFAACTRNQHSSKALRPKQTGMNSFHLDKPAKIRQIRDQASSFE